MPIPTNKRLADALIGHNVDLHRVEAQFNLEIQKLLEKLKKDLLKELAAAELDTPRTDWQKARMREFLKASEATIKDTYDNINSRMTDNLKGLIEVSSDAIVINYNKTLGADLLQPVKWTDETLHRIASDTMIQGAVSREWWSRQSTGFTNKFKDEMRMGMLKGENLAQLKKRIVQDVIDFTNIPKRDIIRTAKRNAEALVRTSTLTVMREAHLDVYSANLDVLDGVQWLSTLDSRTTEQCRARDGLVWTLPDYQPKGHNIPFPGPSPHWNCRSVIIPVTKSWEELAKEAGGDTELAKQLDDIPEGQRASIGGPVEGGMTYNEWFAGQTPERQDEVNKPLTSDDVWVAKRSDSKIDPKAYKEWASKVLETWQASDEVRAVGTMDETLIKKIKAEGLKPLSATIEISDRDILHIMRETKLDRGAAIPTDSLLELPAILQNPRAVLFDKRDSNLLYVFEPDGVDRHGKFVVKIGIKSSVAGSKSKQVLNRIMTAGLVPRLNLVDQTFYKTLIGVL